MTRHILSALLALLLVGQAAIAHGQQPRSALTGYKQTSWTIEDEVPAAISSLTQSKDGFIWLGTQIGIFRFDGTRFERVPAYERLNGAGASLLHAAHNGDLWIVYGTGQLARARNGRVLMRPNGGPKNYIHAIVETPQGDLWFAGRQMLSNYREGRWTDIASPFRPVDLAYSQDGTLWLLGENQLHYLRKGESKLRPVVGEVRDNSRIEVDATNKIWIADSKELREVRNSRGKSPSISLPGLRFPSNVGSLELLAGGDGVLWLAGQSNSIIRIQNSASGETTSEWLETPPQASTFAGKPLQDIEGNIWVATELGLDRFRPVDLIHESAVNPLLAASKAQKGDYQVIADGRKRVYVRQGQRLFRMEGRKAVALPWPATLGKWDRVCAAQAGGLWVRTARHVIAVVDGSKARSVRFPKGLKTSGTALVAVRPCLEDASGHLWVGLNPEGYFRHDGSTWKQFAVAETWSALPFTVGLDRDGSALAWHGYGHLVRTKGERSSMLWHRQAVTLGFIATIAAGPRHLLIGGESGVSRYDGKTFKTLPTSRFPMFQDVSGIVQNRHGDTWLLSKLGLLKTRSADLERAFDDPSSVFDVRSFDHDDGLLGSSEVQGFDSAVEAADGRLWLATSNGIFSLDPSRLRQNNVRPPVTILRAEADGSVFPANSNLDLPSGIGTLRIEYTALSFAVPKRVRFRYRLVGVDSAWVDAGARREAVYTSLAPGNYTFQVMAANDQGLWNERPAVLAVSVPPTFIQSRLFLVIAIVASVLILWSIYSLRVRQISSRLRERIEERLRERERIARELHDTLLQGVQGLILQFQTAADDLSPQSPARHKLARALDQAETLLVDGRDRVQGLRTFGSSNSLIETLHEALERLPTDSIRVSRTVEGVARPIDPMVIDEITRIIDEALANAVQHSGASEIDLGISFQANALVIRLRDNGRGIPAEVVRDGGRVGHFGLVGMRERAERIESKFEISSAPNGGTKVRLAVPARVAYVMPPKRWLPTFARWRAVEAT